MTSHWNCVNWDGTGHFSVLNQITVCLSKSIYEAPLKQFTRPWSDIVDWFQWKMWALRACFYVEILQGKNNSVELLDNSMCGPAGKIIWWFGSKQLNRSVDSRIPGGCNKNYLASHNILVWLWREDKSKYKIRACKMGTVCLSTERLTGKHPAFQKYFAFRFKNGIHPYFIGEETEACWI